MSTLSGILLSAATGRIQAPSLSSSLDTIAITRPPFGTSADAEAVTGALGRTMAAAQPRELTSRCLASYFDDYYFRIHTNPQRLDLGYLVTAQTRDVEIWNAWPRRSITLSDMTIVDGNGVTATAPGALPLTFAPLAAQVWTLDLSVTGSPALSADATWTFDAGTVRVPITAQRAAPWPIRPHWGAGLDETLISLTEVQEAVDGSQLRIAHRDVPRRQWEFSPLVAWSERQIMESLLYAWRGRTYALPVWVDAVELDAPVAAGAVSIAVSTSGLDFSEGGLAMLFAASTAFELVELQSVSPTALSLARPSVSAWPVGARLIPCRLARITDTPKIQRHSSNVASGSIRFEAVGDCSWPAAAPATTYLGLPVLEVRPEESEDPTWAPDRQLATMDGDVGLVRVDDVTGMPWLIASQNWQTAGRTARAALRGLLYWLNGRANALWVPSFSDDVELAADMPEGSVALRVAACGITQYGFGLPGRRHLRIERAGGSIDYRAAKTASVLADGSEQFVLSAPLLGDLTKGNVERICWMMLATGHSDSVTVHHEADSDGVATMTATFVGVGAEEPAA